MSLTSVQVRDEMTSTNLFNMLDGNHETGASRAEGMQTISTHEADLALVRARMIAGNTPADVLRIVNLLDDIFDEEDEEPTGTVVPVDTAPEGRWTIAS